MSTLLTGHGGAKCKPETSKLIMTGRSSRWPGKPYTKNNGQCYDHGRSVPDRLGLVEVVCGADEALECGAVPHGAREYRKIGSRVVITSSSASLASE